MYRPAARAILRSTQSSLAPARTLPTRRFISTESPHLRSRSWKSSALRWGIAIAGIYYYNTSPVFAEQPQSNLLNPNLDALDDEESPSLDVLAARRKNKNAQTIHSAADALSSENASTSVSSQSGAADSMPAPGSPQELEEEAAGEGAFNPETGEINWDCPCLGGMAHGPCGPQFREAFSCFVFSEDEPKGMDCIDKFQGMRDCFQQHPEVYKDELMDDEELDAELENEKQELTQQIAERREAEQAAEGAGQRRLLEEPAPEPRVKATRKVESKPGSSEQKSEPREHKKESGEQRTEPRQQKKEVAPKPESAQRQQSETPKQPEMTPADKDNTNDGQRSSTIRQPSPPPVSDMADRTEDMVVPKAAHDARESKA